MGLKLRPLQDLFGWKKSLLALLDFDSRAIAKVCASAVDVHKTLFVSEPSTQFTPTFGGGSQNVITQSSHSSLLSSCNDFFLV